MSNNFFINNKQISKVGFGCGFRLDDDLNNWRNVSTPIIHEALRNGFNFLDTAECYGRGCSEQIIASVLNEYGQRDQICIATKVSPENLRKNDLIKACEQSLSRLKLSQIDLYQIHWSNPAISIEDTFEALGDLLESGKVAEVGVGNFSLLELKKAEEVFKPYKISSVQVEYNLLDRSIDLGLLPYCKSSNKKIIAYSPLNQGSIPGSPEAKKVLDDISSKYNVSNEAVILDWIVSKGILPIPNTKKLERLHDYSAVFALNIESGDHEIVDKYFPYAPLLVDPKEITVSQNGLWSPSVYSTLEEARLNAAAASPSPSQLAAQFEAGDFLKPVRVRRLKNKLEGCCYELVEGRMRYWGWLLAFGYEKPIPVLLRD